MADGPIKSAEPTTVGELLDRPVSEHPDKTAVVFRDRRWSFAAFRERVDRLANALVSLGLRPGERLAMFVDTSDRAWETIVACARAGIIWVPVNFMLKERELATILKHSGARALVVDENHYATFAAVRPELPALEFIISIGKNENDRSPDVIFDYEALIDRGSTVRPEITVSPDDIFCLLYTSGTTGLPKGTMLTNRSILAHAQYAIREYCLKPDSVGLVVLPYFVGATLNVIQIPGLLLGMTLVFCDRFSPSAFYELIQSERATHVQTVPTLIVRLMEAPETSQPWNLDSLVTIGYGSAPMPVDRLRQALARFGPIFTQIYGLTETCAMATCLHPHEQPLAGPHEDLPAANEEARRRLSSCGRPVDGVDVRIVDENGQEVSPCALGEIVIRGRTLMRGYWNNPDATDAAMRDGWFYTGDVAWRDDDGYIYITDRRNDMIISGAINIYPQEIEQVISTHPAVYESAVIGLPDPEWGEAVTAVVALKPGRRATAGEIINHCRESLAGYKKPRSIVFVDEIPRNPSGKVLKRLLRDRFGSLSGRCR